MDVIIDSKKSTKAFGNIAVGDCFLLDGFLWVKAGKSGEYPFAQRVGSSHALVIQPAREVSLVNTVTASS